MTTSSNGDATTPVSRRDFVRTSALAGAGALLAAPFVHAGGSDRIRVGLVGCGGRGTGAAMQALRADDGVVLVSLGDLFPDQVETCRRNLRGSNVTERVDLPDERCHAGFDAYRQVIDEVDVVLLAATPVFRPQHLRYAVDAGVHVFCEKPVAVDAPGIRSVIESAAEARRRRLALVSGFCWRYHTAEREAYARVLDGSIGAVRAIQTTYNTGPLADVAREPDWSDTEWQLRNWKAFIWASGDHIVEQACHAIDWIDWAMGGRTPTRAVAVGGRQCRGGDWTGNMYDHFGVTYEFADGGRAHHMCRQIANCSNDNSAFIIGTEGTCYSNPFAQIAAIEGRRPWRFEAENNDMYQQEHDDLFRSIRAGDPIDDGDLMARSTMLAIMGRMCAYSGQTLTWEQCMASEVALLPPALAWGELAFPAVPMPGRTKVV